MTLNVAGAEGLEPSPAVLETDMLPLTPYPYLSKNTSVNHRFLLIRIILIEIIPLNIIMLSFIRNNTRPVIISSIDVCHKMTVDHIVKNNSFWKSTFQNHCKEITISILPVTILRKASMNKFQYSLFCQTSHILSNGGVDWTRTNTPLSRITTDLPNRGLTN